MQHIHAELLRCESELRFLQSTEDRVAPQWDRFVAFFKALRSKAFDVRRISGTEDEKRRITTVLNQMGVVFESDDRMMIIDWQVSRAPPYYTTSVTYYPHIPDIRYVYSEGGTVKEKDAFRDKAALLTLLTKVFTCFGDGGPSRLAGLLVDAFFDVSDEVAHDSEVKAEWDRWKSFFRSLTAENFNVDLINTPSDVRADITRLLGQIEITVDSNGLSVDVRWNTKARGCFMSFYYVPSHMKIKSRLKTGPKNAFRNGKDVDDPRPVYGVVTCEDDLKNFMDELMTDVYEAETTRALFRRGAMQPFGWFLMSTFYKA
jgi:hypothetical protein